MRYNYVYFNATYANKLEVDLDDYNSICTRDLESLENVQVIPTIMAHKAKFFKFLYYCHEKLSRMIRFPFIELWYPSFFKNRFSKSKKPLCFVIASSQIPIRYVRWLKKHYSNAKFVRVHRDLFKVTCRNGYTDKFLNENFDVQMTFDENEASSSGALYFDEIESKIDISDSPLYPQCDVFFAGKAKDRFPKIIDFLRRFNEEGLDCYFYVTEVPIEQQINIKGIVYGSKFMSYKEMLYRTVRSKCILEINQEGAVGYTSRFIEAVLYNKKLITDNIYIKRSKFYDKRFIQCIGPGEMLDAGFVNEDVVVDFKYNNEFSPINILNKIEVFFKEKDNQ